MYFLPKGYITFLWGSGLSNTSKMEAPCLIHFTIISNSSTPRDILPCGKRVFPNVGAWHRNNCFSAVQQQRSTIVMRAHCRLRKRPNCSAIDYSQDGYPYARCRLRPVNRAMVIILGLLVGLSFLPGLHPSTEKDSP